MHSYRRAYPRGDYMRGAYTWSNGSVNPIWHGMMAPQNGLYHCVPECLGGGNWNLLTLILILCGIKNSYFWFPRLSGVTMATSLSGSTRDFLILSFHMFPYNKILKVFKSKIWIDIWKKALQNTSKYQILAISVKGFGSYEHLKFRPTRQLK